MGLHIIITGNPVEGFRYFGPFKTHDDATQCADENQLQEWWTAKLEAGAEAEG